MNITIKSKKEKNLKTEALVIGIFEDLEFSKKEYFQNFDKEAEKAHFKGKIGESFFYSEKMFEPKKNILFVGLGKKKDYSVQCARNASSLAIRKLQERNIVSAELCLKMEESKEKKWEIASAIAEGIILTNTKYQRYITDKERISKGLDQVILCVNKEDKDYEKGLKIGQILSESVLFARDLITAPSNEITPDYLAEEAASLAKAYGFKAKIMDENECKKMGMGAFLAVAQGSQNKPRLIHLSYKAKGAKKTIGFVGKGLTFDSGGISLKPAEGMGAMKSDMAGAAAVLGAMKAVGELKPKVNIEMVVAACENMPSGSAMRPGDIIKSMSGKTIEIQNTDAEGRLTLADALT
ncbi:MAG: aminopeptidase, partial [Acidobacteria bacterium]|nr:aminopeptidase [Acidobacteriota bacterium]